MAGISIPQSSLARRTAAGHVYVPPDFEPHFRPNMSRPGSTEFTPPSSSRVNTSHISPYETLPDSGALNTTDFLDDGTGSFFVKAATALAGFEGKNPKKDATAQSEHGDSTLEFKDLEAQCAAMLQQAAVAHDCDSTIRPTAASEAVSFGISDVTSFRGPDIQLKSLIQKGKVHDLAASEKDLVAPRIDCRQPSWPPTFTGPGDQSKDHADNKDVQALPVHSVTDSADSSYVHAATVSGFSDDKSLKAGSRDSDSKGADIAVGTKVLSTEAVRAKPVVFANQGPRPLPKRSIFHRVFGCFS